MKGLTNRQMQALLDAVILLHANLDTSTLHARIFNAIKRAVPAEFFAIDYFHPRGAWMGRELSATEPIDATSPEYARIFEAYVHEHPLIDEFLRTGLPTPRKITDLVTTSRFHRLGIYNEFYRLIGVDRQMALGLPITAEILVSIALNRSKRDFTEGERRILGLLRPHLMMAYHNAEALAHLQLQHMQLQSALERAGVGAILFDMNGHEEFVTEQAHLWLQKYFSAPHRSASDLPEELTDWMTHYVSVAVPDKILAAPVPPLEVVCADARLRIRLLIDSEAKQVLMLMEEKATVTAKALETLGLTKREAEVLSWVMRSKTNPEIAILCGISQRTAQKHLEHIYVKFGVSSRGAAAQLAVEMLQRNG
jgi:DNA-binding CsgD family transcriptional regulator